MRSISVVLAAGMFILWNYSAGYTQHPLPVDETTLFSGSGICQMCHESDGIVLEEAGVDISPVTLWRSSMMSNSNKDPLWRAVAEEEVTTFPELQTVIESRCTNCHAPLGYSQAIHDGEEGYSLQEMDESSLARDGVSCTICHQIQASNLGMDESYSGGFLITEDRHIFGPYPDPLVMPMYNTTGFTPVYGEHVHDSELCATCHTLFTPTVNYSGEIVGEFPEQTPYLEWKNSDYYNEESCQDCHIPVTDTPVDIASRPPWHTLERTPFWKHYFEGSNSLILNILQDNIEELGLSATEAHFDTTIAHTRNILQSQTVNVTANHNIIDSLLFVSVRIENLAGHKLPSGIPIRRMWIHLKVMNSDSQTIFESGEWDENGVLPDHDENYEPHYLEITDQNQIQIYEGVMADVDGDPTFTLLRAHRYLKDNRIPPRGFTTDHPAYDTTGIIGSAVEDPDFNIENEVEGSGADEIRYVIPISLQGKYTVDVEICYQTVKPGMTNHLFELDVPEINQFKTMYEENNRTPVILDSIEFLVEIPTQVNPTETTPTTTKRMILAQNYPNPFNPSTTIGFDLPEAEEVTLQIFDAKGNLVTTLLENEVKAAEYHQLQFDAMNLQSGIYLYRLRSRNDSRTRAMVLVR